MRERYGMTNPRYAVIHGYKTVLIQADIVEAVPDPSGALTGLLVDVAPKIQFGSQMMDNWDRLDRLEGGYTRVKVDTTLYDECWMYVAK